MTILLIFLAFGLGYLLRLCIDARILWVSLDTLSEKIIEDADPIDFQTGAVWMYDTIDNYLFPQSEFKKHKENKE